MLKWILVGAILLARVATPSAPGVTTAAHPRADLPVSALHLTALTIVPPQQIVPVGGFGFFQAIGTFSNGTAAEVTHTVTWDVSSPTEAAIVDQGRVQGSQPGIVTISASSGMLTASALALVQ